MVVNDDLNIEQLRQMISKLRLAGRYDALLEAIGVPVLQQLNIEAARQRLSPLVITSDYRFMLTLYNKEVKLAPIHKALYILFLMHPEGIEFKRLHDFRDELLAIYRRICNRSTEKVIEDSIDRLVNPLDNSVNEKCARIKNAFSTVMDEYQLSYYAISGHAVRHIEGSTRVWFERKKNIMLPRHLVTMEFLDDCG